MTHSIHTFIVTEDNAKNVLPTDLLPAEFNKSY